MMRSARMAGVAQARALGWAFIVRIPWLSAPIASFAVARCSPSGVRNTKRDSAGESPTSKSTGPRSRRRRSVWVGIPPLSRAAPRARNRAASGSLCGMEPTPERISELPDGSIFVCGSNESGAHGGGAARVALDRFGAIWGQGEGLQGQSYGLPTMEGFDALRGAAERFVAFAREHPE